jgi:hypothetical protein
MNESEYEFLLKKIEELEIRIEVLENNESQPVLSKPKLLSIKEFLLKCTYKDEIQKTLLICYYLEKYLNKERVNIKDIEEGFKQAKEPSPDNINYKVYMIVKKGYMMEDMDTSSEAKIKHWTLTNSGEKFVDEKLSNH